MKAIFPALAFLALSALSAHAQNTTPQLTPQQLEERDRHLRNAIGLAEQMEAMVDQVTAEKKMQCVKSVGNLQFLHMHCEREPAFRELRRICHGNLTHQ
jgi:hypothetical protein